MRTAVLLLLCAVSSVAQAPKNTRDSLLIAKVRDSFWKAFQEKNVAVLGSMLADDYYEPTATGTVTKADVLGAAAKTNMTDFALDQFKVIWFGQNAAIVSYDVRQHWTMDGQEGPTHVRASTAWVHRGGKWMIVFHQETTAK